MDDEELTREELVSICEAATVPQAAWTNRDSAAAQMQVGQCWALLRAGCEFEVRRGDAYLLRTDAETIWLTVDYEGFSCFETGGIDLRLVA